MQAKNSLKKEQDLLNPSPNCNTTQTVYQNQASECLRNSELPFLSGKKDLMPAKNPIDSIIYSSPQFVGAAYEDNANVEQSEFVIGATPNGKTPSGTAVKPESISSLLKPFADPSNSTLLQGLRSSSSNTVSEGEDDNEESKGEVQDSLKQTGDLGKQDSTCDESFAKERLDQ